MRHVHFIGIGGTGLSAIARILVQRGYEVSGSDNFVSVYFNDIARDGAKTFLGHHPDNVRGADVVVRSSAIKDDNPEVISAIQLGIPVLKRSDFLPMLLKSSDTIAIAGSHGKTTTTSMILFMLHEIGADPSFISGAIVKQLATNAHAGSSDLFVIEADEYDYMFLGLNPLISVITNIEHDHPDCFPTPEAYMEAFVQFLSRQRPNGTAFLCVDDPGVRQLLTRDAVTLVNFKTYGLKSNTDYLASGLKLNPAGCFNFDFVLNSGKGAPNNLGNCRLLVPGEHNVQNALAALAVIHTLGFPLSEALNALSRFQGADRRFDICDPVAGITIVNDYAHHPTQIDHTIAAARTRFPGAPIWVVWEPHTYTRTAALEKDFCTSLSRADHVIITRIYPAREKDNGYTPLGIVDALGSKKACYIPDFDQVAGYLVRNLAENDVLLVLSAGNAPAISQKTLALLKDRL